MPDTTLVTRIYPPDARWWRKITRGDRVAYFAYVGDGTYEVQPDGDGGTP